MDKTGVEEIETLAKGLINSYLGKVELYFLRYGEQTVREEGTEEAKKVPKPVFYEAEIERDVQKQLLDIFLHNIEYYKELSDNILPYDIVDKENDVLANLPTDTFTNVNDLMTIIKNKTGFINSLNKLNLNSVVCFCARIELAEDKYVYYFGRIDKFTRLKKGFFANISNSAVEKLELGKFFGFINFIIFFEYEDELLIKNQDNFNTVFKMKDFFEAKAIPILDIIESKGKVSGEDIIALKELCSRDSRVAKRIMKLGTDEEKINIFFENLGNESFQEIINDPFFREKFGTLSYEDDKITCSSTKTDVYYRELAMFIRDTASRAVISRMPSISD
ncbi:Kiwa anti-phage protein KwaB-like domain-containing protein [Marinilactibacillus psychrotolerans]|uniref:Kiwa anti-phage protein KwaB-like domain-containing protein n=1 Tax=Marinilactibacillus psychrotolerans TaxID=191770 RepID=UPI00388AB801